MDEKFDDPIKKISKYITVKLIISEIVNNERTIFRN